MKRSSNLHCGALDTVVLGVLFKVYFCIALREDNGQSFCDRMIHISITT